MILRRGKNERTINTLRNLPTQLTRDFWRSRLPSDLKLPSNLQLPPQYAIMSYFGDQFEHHRMHTTLGSSAIALTWYVNVESFLRLY